MTDDVGSTTGGAGTTAASPAVELLGITKHFGQVAACDAVDLTLRRGQIHGVLGENGAGKSTLMKVLIGLVLPDRGQIRIDGEIVHIADPVEAAARGIGMVHQHFSLVEPLTVWENVALGDVGRLTPKRVRERVVAISDQYGLEIDPDARVSDLPAGMRQRVEIIKCLRRDPQILVFDEPTSVLSPAESQFLFETLRRVVEIEGKAVALVSHKLAEIMYATDEITIMRQGRVVESLATSEANEAGLARAMVGRDVSLRSERAAFGLALGNVAVVTAPAEQPHAEAAVIQAAGKPLPLLELWGIGVIDRDGRHLLDEFSLTVGPGEIVGVAGVEGNGQRALGDLLSSLLHTTVGTVLVDGEPVAAGVAGAMARARIAVIPEDRHDSGVILDMSVTENLFLADPARFSRRGFMNPKRMRAEADSLIAEFGIVCSSASAPLWSLSGGNQQRVVLARELSHRPKVLVAAQPTRGLDVGAIEYMAERLRAAASSGVGVLLISTELEEILELADRIVVLYRGRLVGEMTRADVDLERLGLLMGTGRAEAEHATNPASAAAAGGPSR